MTTKLQSKNIDSGSFRDPSGFIFYRNNQLYRQINKSYQNDFDLFISSNLYQTLVDKNLLIPHQEVDVQPFDADTAYKIISPEKIKFISYPYEWSFSQLKDAALATLKIQKIALEKNMVLKDASAYNIQFENGRPVFIDTLSFEKYQSGRPWVGYRQFCQHFLAPLALCSYTDIRLNQLMRTNIDGVPLDLAAKLLPIKTKLNFGLLTHLHLHSKSQKKFADQPESTKKINLKMNKHSLTAMVDNLENTVNKLKWKETDSEWGEYYTFTNYSKSAFKNKKELVKKYLKKAGPKTIWDLGANNGEFTRLINKKAYGISFDIDPAAVEKNYLQVKEKKETNILPLILDLTNPPPSLGWANQERKSLVDRGPADTLMALALIHHLAISNNLPFDKIAEFFSRLSNYLIIEFVPKTDSQVKKLLASREDIFDNYDQNNFEAAFKNYFDILETDKIKEARRTLYLMKKK
jgi:ribosomal protein L11 methylase PrmA